MKLTALFLEIGRHQAIPKMLCFHKSVKLMNLSARNTVNAFVKSFTVTESVTVWTGRMKRIVQVS